MLYDLEINQKLFGGYVMLMNLERWVLLLLFYCLLGCTDSSSHSNDKTEKDLSFLQSNSYITISNATVKAGESISVKLMLRDQDGTSYVPSADESITVIFTCVGGTSQGTFGAVENLHDGTFLAEFTGKIAGTATEIVATINGSSFANSPPSVTVLHGPAQLIVFSNQPASTAEGSILTTQPSIAIKDAFGNTVTSGADSTAFISMSLSSGSGSLLGTTTVVAVLGVATWSDLKIDTYGTKILMATKPDMTLLGGTNILTSNSDSFINIGTISLTQSTLVVASNSVTVGSSVSVILTAKDSLGTPIPNQVFRFAVSGGSNVVTQPESSTDSLGQSVGSLSSTMAEQKTISVTTPTSLSSLSVSVNFVSVPTKLSFSLPSSAKSTLCTSGIVISTKDNANSLAAPTSTVHISLNSTNGAFYSDANCTNAISTVDINTGNSSASIYYRGSILGNDLLSATASGLSAASENLFVKGVLKVAAGDFHSCAMMNDGSVYCWGYNYWGQLGQGHTNELAVPSIVPALTGVVDLVAGYGHTCALISGGTVKCWGRNLEGQLGQGNTTSLSSPTLISGLVNVSAISTSTTAYHTCAVISDGSAKCWGYNSSGQLGNGGTTNVTSPTLVTSANNIVSVVVLNASSCFLAQDGSVKCVGLGTSGQLGDGNGTSNVNLVTVLGLDGSSSSNKASSIYGASSTMCATKTDGNYLCWGGNSYSMLGDGTGTNRNSPVSVNYGGSVRTMSIGALHKLVVLTDGTLKVSGGNRSGQLGLNFSTIATVNIATTVSTYTNVVSAVAGTEHSCIVFQNGTVKCFGANSNFQLGGGVRSGSLVPVQATQFSDISSVSVDSYSMCVLKTNGTGQCVGWNQANQLGSGSANSSTSPVNVSSLSNAVSISSGGNIHSCAVLSTGGLSCWGYNSSGQLGDGTTTSRNLATPVNFGASPPSVVKVATGNAHTCSVMSDFTVRCWGSGGSGQLGNGGTSNSSSPVIVSGIDASSDDKKAIDIAAGYAHNCATMLSGSVKCWGAGSSGQLGNGSSNTQTTPVSVTGITNAVQTSTGLYHTCAVLQGGAMKCWGNNSYGQLGNATYTSGTSPVSVTSVSTATLSYAGFYNTCALLQGGSVKCWGMGFLGQLGNGTNVMTQSTPVDVSGLTQVTSLSGGGYGGTHICAVRSDNSLWCWGRNDSSQSGIVRDYSAIDLSNAF